MLRESVNLGNLATSMRANILTLVLIHYTNEALYENFKNTYIHNEAYI